PVITVIFVEVSRGGLPRVRVVWLLIGAPAEGRPLLVGRRGRARIRWLRRTHDRGSPRWRLARQHRREHGPARRAADFRARRQRRRRPQHPLTLGTDKRCGAHDNLEGTLESYCSRTSSTYGPT